MFLFCRFWFYAFLYYFFSFLCINFSFFSFPEREVNWETLKYTTFHKRCCNWILRYLKKSSVADPDPGSGTFLTLWLQKKVWQQIFFTNVFHCCYWIRDPRSGIRDKHPGSATVKKSFHLFNIRWFKVSPVFFHVTFPNNSSAFAEVY